MSRDPSLLEVLALFLLALAFIVYFKWQEKNQLLRTQIKEKIKLHLSQQSKLLAVEIGMYLSEVHYIDDLTESLLMCCLRELVADGKVMTEEEVLVGQNGSLCRLRYSLSS